MTGYVVRDAQDRVVAVNQTSTLSRAIENFKELERTYRTLRFEVRHTGEDEFIATGRNTFRKVRLVGVWRVQSMGALFAVYRQIVRIAADQFATGVRGLQYDRSYRSRWAARVKAWWLNWRLG